MATAEVMEEEIPIRVVMILHHPLPHPAHHLLRLVPVIVLRLHPRIAIRKRRGNRKQWDKVIPKEAEKASVPVYPEMHQFDLWKSQITMSLVTAPGNPDHNKWIKLITPAWSPKPKFEDFSKVKKDYRAIDINVCLALTTSMLKTAGNVACTVRIEVEKLQRHRAKRAKIMSGREVIAIMFENFRSSDY